MGTSLVSLAKACKTFTDGSLQQQVLSSLDFSLSQGESVALTGKSGSGKSTLLNIIAGFEPLSQGELFLDEEPTSAWQDRQWSAFRRQKLGVIFQQFNLLTPLNVRQNIAFMLDLNQREWSDWCDYLVDVLAIDKLLDRHVAALSGGQQQRVAIARALAHQPKLLLADEPTGNLDEQSSQEVIRLLHDISKEGNTAVLLVTHSSASAAFMQSCYQLQNGKLHAVG